VKSRKTPYPKPATSGSGLHKVLLARALKLGDLSKQQTVRPKGLKRNF
jgi:hypothetical protein